MAFRVKESKLKRRNRMIQEGIEAAAKWEKGVRDEYLPKGRQAILHDEALDDTFRFDMLKAKKAMTLMGAQTAKRRLDGTSISQ